MIVSETSVIIEDVTFTTDAQADTGVLIDNNHLALISAINELTKAIYSLARSK